MPLVRVIKGVPRGEMVKAGAILNALTDTWTPRIQINNFPYVVFTAPELAAIITIQNAFVRNLAAKRVR